MYSLAQVSNLNPSTFQTCTQRVCIHESLEYVMGYQFNEDDNIDNIKLSTSLMLFIFMSDTFCVYLSDKNMKKPVNIKAAIFNLRFLCHFNTYFNATKMSISSVRVPFLMVYIY